MSGDGISVKTTLSQLGNVARSQLKTQAVTPAESQNKQLEEKDSRIERVHESEAARKAKIDPDEKRGKGERRRSPARDDDARPDDDEAVSRSDADADEAEERLGMMVDTKA